MKILVPLLLSLVISSCISVPKPEIVLPQQQCKRKDIIYKYEKCRKPPKLSSIPDTLHIQINGDEYSIDSNGESMLRQYVEAQLWLEDCF